MKAWKWKSILGKQHNKMITMYIASIFIYVQKQRRVSTSPFFAHKKQVEVTKGAMNIYKIGKPLNPVTLLKHFHSFHNIIITTLSVIISLPLEWASNICKKVLPQLQSYITLILCYLSGIFFRHCPLSGINKDLFIFQMRDEGAIQLYHY